MPETMPPMAVKVFRFGFLERSTSVMPVLLIVKVSKAVFCETSKAVTLAFVAIPKEIKAVFELISADTKSFEAKFTVSRPEQ